MDQMQIGKQMIHLYKTAFESTLQAIQEQNERMISMFLEQATWLPQQGKESIKEWIKAIHLLEKQMLSMPITMLAHY